MARFFIKFLLLLLIIFISGIIFISYFGIETDKFDSLIKSKANEVNRHVKLGFQKTKIHLNLEELNLVVKLQNPKILVKKDEIALSKLDLFLPLRSFFTSDFLLKRAEVAFIWNDIKDLTKITNIFLPKIINTRIKKIFSQGEIEGEFIIPFDADGNIRNDYGFSGKVIDASINITKEFNIKNLTTEINHTRENDENIFNIRIRDGSLLDFDLTDSILTLKRKNNETHINSFLKTAGKFNFSKIKKISSLLNININNIEDYKGKTDLKTNIDLKLNNKFRIKKFHYSMNGEVSYAEIYFKKKNNIKKYLPDYNDSIILKDSKIKFIKKNSNNIIELNGLIKIKNEFDSFDLKQIYNFKENNFDIEGNVDLTNSKVNISNLNYNKDSGKKSEINFNINFVLNKYYNIKKLLYISNKTKIDISKLKLNKNFETDNFKKLEIKTFKDGNKNNDFVVKKAKKVIIFGEIFDAEPLLKSLFKKDERRTLSKKFNSEIKINFDRAITGTNDQVNGFGMIATVKKGSFDKLSLKGNFAENEIVEMSIYQIDNNKRTLQVISDRARPFIKNFDFIKGFEGGKLEYESIISKDTSNSSLIITEFKVSKVPALAQLLTLASLQGIADTLSGEGIRFESFEMKSSSKGNVMNIEDALAIGPAVSILMEGYVDKGKLVSLRGLRLPSVTTSILITSWSLNPGFKLPQPTCVGSEDLKLISTWSLIVSSSIPTLKSPPPKGEPSNPLILIDTPVNVE